MKSLKYLLIGSFMLALSVPAMAQDDNKATIDAITKVIKSKPADLEDQVKAVYKKNKKNEDVLVAMGRAFLDIKDTVNATQYVEYALKARSMLLRLSSRETSPLSTTTVVLLPVITTRPFISTRRIPKDTTSMPAFTARSVLPRL